MPCIMFKANNQPGLFSFETQLLDNEQQKHLTLARI